MHQLDVVESRLFCTRSVDHRIRTKLFARQELLHEVQEAKAAAGLAAGAAAEAAAAAAKSREGSASSTTMMSVARGASYETLGWENGRMRVKVKKASKSPHVNDVSIMSHESRALSFCCGSAEAHRGR